MNNPRPTKIHQRRHAAMVATLKRLGKNDDFRFLVVSAGEALRQGDGEAGRVFAQAMVDIICRDEPAYVQLVGRGELLRELATLVTAQLGFMLHPDVSYEAAVEVLIRKTGAFTATRRISPDNDKVSVLRGNAMVKAGATEGQLYELRDYQRSLAPAGKVGRPRKAKKPKGKARPRISDEAIRDTATLSVSEWAKKHAPDLDLADKRQAKDAYARFDRADVRRRRA